MYCFWPALLHLLTAGRCKREEAEGDGGELRCKRHKKPERIKASQRKVVTEKMEMVQFEMRRVRAIKSTDNQELPLVQAREAAFARTVRRSQVAKRFSRFDRSI